MEGFEAGGMIILGETGDFPPEDIVPPPADPTKIPPINSITNIDHVNMWMKSFTNSIVGSSMLILQDKPLNQKANFFIKNENLKDITKKLEYFTELNRMCIKQVNSKLNTYISETISPDKVNISSITKIIEVRPWIHDVYKTHKTISKAVNPYLVNTFIIDWNKKLV